MNEHEHGKDDEMQAGQGLRQSLIVAGKRTYPSFCGRGIS